MIFPIRQLDDVAKSEEELPVSTSKHLEVKLMSKVFSIKQSKLGVSLRES